MSAPIGFFERLLKVVVPTKAQVLGSVFLSLAVHTLAQSQDLLIRIGITQQAIDASQSQFQERFGVILQSPIASHIALITFWSLVGLIAYLICWGLYNIVIEARNEVTLSTAYANRGHWHGAYETLALKAIAAVGLGMMITSLWYGVSFWVALSAQVIEQPSLSTAGTTAVSIIGFAAQLYAVLAFIQLTFTPWYRAESFTDN